jgi:putative effector of murein hydrolase LrgA (UPF0299 family)
MTATAEPPNRPEEPISRRSSNWVWMAAGAGAAALTVVVLWGGYSHRWRWTGINGKTATLWDWLHLLLLPIAVGILPIWFSRRYRLGRHHKLAGMAALGVFGVLVLAGYLIPWAWTGFGPNKLWDWLELLALPLAVALIPTFGELRKGWSPRRSKIAIVGLAVFAVSVLGGYLAYWRWTGFEGNTLWDWLLPLLLPLVIVPALKPVATAGLTDIEDERTGELRAETAAAEPRPPFDQAPTVGDTGPALAGDP